MGVAGLKEDCRLLFHYSVLHLSQTVLQIPFSKLVL